MGTPDTKAILLVEASFADTYLVNQAVEECSPHLLLWTLPDGAEALSFLRKAPPFTHVPTPALIVLDLPVPALSGTEMLGAIRQLPAHYATPIVVLSGTPEEQEEQHCLQLGASAYVQKSANLYLFFDSIKALVRHWLRPEREPVRRIARMPFAST
jgi:CheY-like chemotaxis protein